jgi:hypothetical protein
MAGPTSSPDKPPAIKTKGRILQERRVVKGYIDVTWLAIGGRPVGRARKLLLTFDRRRHRFL